MPIYSEFVHAQLPLGLKPRLKARGRPLCLSSELLKTFSSGAEQEYLSLRGQGTMIR